MLWIFGVAFSNGDDDACDEINDEDDSRSIVDIDGDVVSVDSFVFIGVNGDVIIVTDIDDIGIEDRCDDCAKNGIFNDGVDIDEGDDISDGSVVEAVDKYPWILRANQVKKIEMKSNIILLHHQRLLNQTLSNLKNPLKPAINIEGICFSGVQFS